MKQLFKYYLATSLLLAAISTTAYAVTYKITDLGTQGEYMSNASEINDLGMVVGSTYSGGGPILPQGFMWDGTMHLLEPLPGESWSKAFDINNSGVVVGSSGGRAFMWDGTMHGFEVEALPWGNPISASLINDSGVIVGNILFDNSSILQTFLWDGTMHILDGLAGPYDTVPIDINESGVVVGHSSDRVYKPVMWDRITHELIIPQWIDNGIISGINNSGTVVGSSFDPYSGGSRAFMWDGTLRFLDTIPGMVVFGPTDINDSGVIVGSRIDRAFMWDGTSHDLNDLIDPSTPGWVLKGASAINNKGQIVGYGSLDGGRQRAYLATPVPEPSSMVALLCGLGGLGAMIRRRNLTK